LDSKPTTEKTLIYHPLTLARWEDFERLFSEHGVQNGCWCMYWRTRRVDFQRNYGEGNKLAFKAIVESGKVPGILAYQDEKAAAWCSIAPREDYPSLERSPTLKRSDDQPVWSIVCFYISQAYQGQGLTESLIMASIDYAQSKGAQIVESYPLKTEIAKTLPYERYMGIQSTYERLGFQVVANRSERRLVMRYIIETTKGG
jgi:GNAT superfamily N-acetyltransferase